VKTAYEKERNADKGQSQKKYKQKEIPQKTTLKNDPHPYKGNWIDYSG
jgi:hypothetical protein